MSVSKVSIPIAFLLAISGTSGETQSDSVVNDPTNTLTAGSLRYLLDRREAPIGESARKSEIYEKASRYFAQSCIYGYWRRC
jgi:hypothetical protein